MLFLQNIKNPGQNLTQTEAKIDFIMIYYHVRYFCPIQIDVWDRIVKGFSKLQKFLKGINFYKTPTPKEQRFVTQTSELIDWLVKPMSYSAKIDVKTISVRPQVLTGLCACAIRTVGVVLQPS